MASGIDRTYLVVEGKNLSLRFMLGWATYAQDKVHLGSDTMIPRDSFGVLVSNLRQLLLFDTAKVSVNA